MRDADLEPTGRELKDPAATLIECVDSEGLKHTVISFDEVYRGQPCLTTGVDLIMSFMAYPMVTGLVECNAADTRRARFAYPTGTIWTMKEVLRGFDQVNQAVGTRAALELLYLGGMILHEAGETGPLQGCFSHGNLNPWRIGLKADGQLQVFGYGLAQVEMQYFLHGSGEHVGHDSIRYAPPERLEGQPEQPSSDTYALAAIAYEVITGKPLYDHKDPQKLWDSVKLAEGVQAVRAHKGLSTGLRSMLVDALIYDPDKRLTGMALVDLVGNLLDDPKLEGKTLLEVMERMLNTGARSSRKLVKAATSAFSMEALKAMAAQEDDEDDVELEPNRESRWGSVTREGTTGRGGRAKAHEAAEDAKTTAERPRRREEAESGSTERRRRKRRGSESDEAPVVAAKPVEKPPEKAPEAPEAPEEPSKPAIAERPVAAAEPESSETADGGAEPRRRRRRRGQEEDDASDEAAVVDASASESTGDEGSAAKDDNASNEASASDEDEGDDDGGEEGGDDEVSGVRRRRRRIVPEDVVIQEVVESPRRRRRMTADGEPAEIEDSPRRRRIPADETAAVDEGVEPSDAPRRRRRRNSDD